MIQKILISAVVLIALTGCESLLTRNDIRESERSKQVQELQKSNADVGNRFSDIEQDLRNLNGRVETVEAKLNQNGKESERSKQQLEMSREDQTKKIQILQDELAKMREEMNAMGAELNAMKTAAATSNAEAASEKSTKNSFEIAEEQFEKKEWKKAIVGYQKFRDLNPKSKRFPEATYKIGVCFQELGLKDEAKTFYDEVLGKFPNSAEAKKAKTRLKSLKK
jgi:TolA-binding protein